MSHRSGGRFAIRDAGVQLTTPEPELITYWVVYWVVAQDPDGTVVFHGYSYRAAGLPPDAG